MAQGYFDWTLTGGKDPASLGFGPGWGGGETSNPAVQQAMAGMEQFKQIYQNLLGTAPPPEAMASFAQKALSGAVNAPGDLGYSDTSNLVNSFIQGNYGPQMAQHQQDQQTQQLDKTSGLINNLVSGVTGNTAKLFSDPMSSVYQAFAGNMNNAGITPGSGAFQAGAGSAIAGAGTDAMNNALQTVGIPAIGGIQNAPNQPYSFAQGNSNLSHLNDLSNFGLQADLARSLSGSGGSNLMGQIYGGLNTGANLANAGANMNRSRQSPTWICTHLKKLKLATEEEVEAVHTRLWPSIFRHPIHWLHYLYNAPHLIALCDEVSLDWNPVKEILIDQVLAEPDPEKAWQIYRAECQRLCELYAPQLWVLA